MTSSAHLHIAMRTEKGYMIVAYLIIQIDLTVMQVVTPLTLENTLWMNTVVASGTVLGLVDIGNPSEEFYRDANLAF